MDLEKRVFAASSNNFTELVLEVFLFQYEHNEVYRTYCDLIKVQPHAVKNIRQVPFLPISFFKTHQVICNNTEPEAEEPLIFESSGTTATGNSRHYINDISIYRESFIRCFQRFYGPAANRCILGLLPSYLERNNSSLVFMVNDLIEQSDHKLSGFYLYDFDKLHTTILHNEILQQRTLLIGVTYALLDFAEQFPMQLKHTTVMETGGMKGRREEITRQEVHRLLQENLGITSVHSEYGMTELLSQAYSRGEGIFHCPGWMKILIREEDDPFALYTADDVKVKPINGAINVIDLANIYSCSFIATSDLGKLYSNQTFEVLGRLDNSDIRGCSLLAL
ncbi:MAG: acyl transferase [Bacteroidetes bacterium]|nr:acyl transferase [Bacteroidota bacterium]